MEKNRNIPAFEILEEYRRFKSGIKIFFKD